MCDWYGYPSYRQREGRDARIKRRLSNYGPVSPDSEGSFPADDDQEDSGWQRRPTKQEFEPAVGFWLHT
jgi:hypothetical protein